MLVAMSPTMLRLESATISRARCSDVVVSRRVILGSRMTRVRERFKGAMRAKKMQSERESGYQGGLQGIDVVIASSSTVIKECKGRRESDGDGQRRVQMRVKEAKRRRMCDRERLRQGKAPDVSVASSIVRNKTALTWAKSMLLRGLAVLGTVGRAHRWPLFLIWQEHGGNPISALIAVI